MLFLGHMYVLQAESQQKQNKNVTVIASIVCTQLEQKLFN